MPVFLVIIITLLIITQPIFDVAVVFCAQWLLSWTAAYSPIVMPNQYCQQWTIYASRTHSAMWHYTSMGANFQSTVLSWLPAVTTFVLCLLTRYFIQYSKFYMVINSVCHFCFITLILSLSFMLMYMCNVLYLLKSSAAVVLKDFSLLDICGISLIRALEKLAE